MFAPAFRPSDGQRARFAGPRERKRKRSRDADDHSGSSGGDDDDDADSDEAGRRPESLPASSSPSLPSSPPPTESGSRAVSRTDPYHVAGYAREAPLPPPPFPHAAAPSSAAASARAAVSASADGDPPPTSRKRRHVETLTTVLHTRLLRGDWLRAARAWGLLLRTELAGRGIDVRRHGRWGIGAELLMRRRPADDGFRRAREYYDRLILQYPHTARTQHGTTAVTFYPALFGVWVYEVQRRFTRARRRAAADRPMSPSSSSSSLSSLSSLPSESGDCVDRRSPASDAAASIRALRSQELAEAVPILQRMDELLGSPPYDTHWPLVRLRGMVGLWIADLHHALGDWLDDDNDDVDGAEHDDVGHVHERDGLDATDARQHLEQAQVARTYAVRALRRVRDAGGELPASVVDLLDENDDDI